MIQLFDRYGQESRDLHESLEAAGLSHVTVVIEPDGFLPDGISFSLYLLSRLRVGKSSLFQPSSRT